MFGMTIYKRFSVDVVVVERGALGWVCIAGYRRLLHLPLRRFDVSKFCTYCGEFGYHWCGLTDCQ